MENIFKYKGLIIALVASIAFGVVIAPGCREKVVVKPVVVVVKDTLPTVVADTVAWYCTPIAPMKGVTSAVGQKGKFWPVGATIKIGFTQPGTTALRDAVKAAYAKWGQSANLKFEYPAAGPYNIRVSFNSGSAWSYIGTDCNFVGSQYPTLNYGFGGSNVIEHEAGHSLGLLHEQQLAGGICWNEASVIADLSQPPNSWDLATIRFNVLDYHNPANVITNGYDKTSIMHYAIPARWTCNNVAIPGGSAISAADKAFATQMYPGAAPPPPPPPPINVMITTAQRDNLRRIQNLSRLYADSVTIYSKKIFGI